MVSLREVFKMRYSQWEDEQWKIPLLSGIATTTCMLIAYDILILFVYELGYLLLPIMVAVMIAAMFMFKPFLKAERTFRKLKPFILWIGGIYGAFFVIEWAVRMVLCFDFFLVNDLVPPTVISFIAVGVNFLYIGSITLKAWKIKRLTDSRLH